MKQLSEKKQDRRPGQKRKCMPCAAVCTHNPTLTGFMYIGTEKKIKEHNAYCIVVLHII